MSDCEQNCTETKTKWITNRCGKTVYTKCDGVIAPKQGGEDNKPSGAMIVTVTYDDNFRLFEIDAEKHEVIAAVLDGQTVLLKMILPVDHTITRIFHPSAVVDSARDGLYVEFSSSVYFDGSVNMILIINITENYVGFREISWAASV